MSVFTVFFCGTCSNSFDFANSDYYAGEIVSTLARNACGMEFVNWIIVDGPGSGNHQEDEKFVKPGYYGASDGIATGAGWEENVQHAMAVIRGRSLWARTYLSAPEVIILKEADIDLQVPVDSRFKRRFTPQDLQTRKIAIHRASSPITAVNVIGWSRGAVTAHMFANAMYADSELRRVPIRMIAVDPVPGTANFQANRTHIPKNVRTYVAFFARDERSFGFAATVPSREPGTWCVYYPMPGRHATLSGNAGTYIKGNGPDTFFSPGRVVRMISEDFLTLWGTSLNSKLPYSEIDMLKCYDEMIRQHDGYKAMRSTVYTTQIGQKDDRDMGVGSKWQSMKFNKVQHLAPDGLFVNWHHHGLFRTHYPDAYRFFTTRNAPPMADGGALIQREYPEIWWVLNHFKLTGDRTGPK